MSEALGSIPSISPSKDERIAKDTQIHSMDLPLSRIVPPCSVEQFPVPTRCLWIWLQACSKNSLLQWTTVAWLPRTVFLFGETLFRTIGTNDSQYSRSFNTGRTL